MDSQTEGRVFGIAALAVACIPLGWPSMSPLWQGAFRVAAIAFAFIAIALVLRGSLRTRWKAMWPQILMLVSIVGFLVGLTGFLQKNVTTSEIASPAPLPRAAQQAVRRAGIPTPSLVHALSANMPGENLGLRSQDGTSQHAHRTQDAIASHAGVAVGRQKYIVHLQALYAEGGDVMRYLIAAPTEDDFDRRMDRMWEWMTRVGMWTCTAMGAPAMTKATAISLNDAPKIQPSADNPALSSKKLGTLWMIQKIQQNLSDMVERDVWDPIGQPILPSGGCEKAVGRATDPAAHF